MTCLPHSEKRRKRRAGEPQDSGHEGNWVLGGVSEKFFVIFKQKMQIFMHFCCEKTTCGHKLELCTLVGAMLPLVGL